MLIILASDRAGCTPRIVGLGGIWLELFGPTEPFGMLIISAADLDLDKKKWMKRARGRLNSMTSGRLQISLSSCGS